MQVNCHLERGGKRVEGISLQGKWDTELWVVSGDGKRQLLWKATPPLPGQFKQRWGHPLGRPMLCVSLMECAPLFFSNTKSRWPTVYCCCKNLCGCLKGEGSCSLHAPPEEGLPPPRWPVVCAPCVCPYN